MVSPYYYQSELDNVYGCAALVSLLNWTFSKSLEVSAILIIPICISMTKYELSFFENYQ